MHYCINPWCLRRQNSDEHEACQQCGTPLLINDRFWLLQPLRPLTSNAYYDVFEAMDTTGSFLSPPGSLKALKVLRIGNEKLIPALQRETRILQLINHPQIPKADLDDYFTIILDPEDAPLHCLAMQKIEGQTLDVWIEEHGRINQNQALDWLEQLADILQCVHQANIVHRDIKPLNIIVQPDHKLALIDFGGAEIKTGAYTGVTDSQANTLIGTVGYTPVEQINGEAVPESDFYSMGLSLISAIVGKPLNELPLDRKVVQRQWKAEARHIDPPLVDLLEKLTAVSVLDRPRYCDLVKIVEQLPQEVKKYRRLNSPWFKSAIGLLVLLTLFGLYKGGSYLASQHYLLQGSNKLFDGNLKEAKKDLELAIRLDPSNADAYHNLGGACQSLGDIECTFKSYNKALEIDPNRWDTYNVIGGYYDDQRQYDLAVKYYLKSIELGGDLAIESISNLARVYILQGKYSEAIRLIQRGLAATLGIPEMQATFYKNQGWAQFELKQYDQALANLMKSADLGYNNADTYCLIAKVYESKKLEAQSKVYWEACLRFPTSNPEVEEWRTNVIDRFFFKNKDQKLP